MSRLETTVATDIDPSLIALPSPSLRATVGAMIELTKPRITQLVLVTTGVGFVLAALGQTWTVSSLLSTGLLCLIGTALSSAGANALNQWWERRRDALMPRTKGRPLPTERLKPATAAAVGVSCGAIGVLILWLLVTPAAAVVSLATILIYVFIYTPMKPVTTVSTIVGAIPGALPPVIGWAAVATPGNEWMSLASPAPWSLFSLMFVWQIPHFLAIAWMHRDGYAQGGFCMLPLHDPVGWRTARTSLAWAAALIPVSLTPILTIPDRLGWGYAIVAILLGAMFLRSTIRFVIQRDNLTARKVFFASIIYLPLILLAMMVDSIVRTIL
jgi:heme o synthase